ncbi:MAG: hypothetical protein GXO99_05815 [Nitrospirae bacterium]|nr:hypothetical protein [Nitrospirota bacterium]
MNPFSELTRFIKEKKERYYYRRRFRELERELESLRKFIEFKLNSMEKNLNDKITQLEFRVQQLEDYKKEADCLSKVLDSCDPDIRRN